VALGPRWQRQRGHQRGLHFAEDLGAEAKAVGELPEAQGLQVSGQSRHHAQQQLGKMLRLDLDVGLLGMLGTNGRQVKTREDVRGNYWASGKR